MDEQEKERLKMMTEESVRRVRKQNPLIDWRKETVRVSTVDHKNNVKIERRHRLYHQAQLKQEFATLKELHYFLRVNIIQPTRVK